MRTRFAIFILSFLAVALALIFWMRPVPRPPIQTPTPVTTQTIVQPAGNTNVVNVNAPVAVMENASPKTNAESVSNTDESRRMNVLQQFIEKNNAPIQLFGKVVDQDNNALAGAHIKISINHLIMPPAPFFPEVGSKYIELEKTSDAEGRFEIHGETGKGMGIGTITKNGYELEPNRYGYGPTAGSYDIPVIFKMWSTNIHEQLITGDKSFEIVPDGRAYFIDLTKGIISESSGGDLRIWIQYTNQVVQGQLYDWSAGIEVVNGGLLEVPQAVMNSGFWPDPPFAMYSAPADGYTPSFSMRDQIKGGQSGEIGNRFFYLLLNNGKEYGRMSINLFAPYGRLHPGLIRISYAINPSGSRILR